MSRIRILEDRLAVFGRDFGRVSSISSPLPPILPPTPPPSSLTVPSAPRNVTASTGALSRSANISWQVPVTDGGSPILSYTVIPSPDTGSSPVVSFPTTTATVLNLTDGVVYTFRVIATNVVGNSPPSSVSNTFTPNELPEAALWFDPSLESTLTLDSQSRVLAIDDLTNNNNDGQYTDPAHPTVDYVPPDYTEINGLGAIRIDNSGSTVNIIKVPGDLDVASPQNFNDEFVTYAFVLRYISGSSGFVATDTPGQFGRGIGVNNGNLETISYNTFQPWPAISIPPDEPTVIVASISATDWIVSINGVRYSLDLEQAKTPDNVQGLNIGCWNPTNAVSVVFDVGEVLVYKSFLTPTQISQVESYLGAKWNIAIGI